MDKVLVDKWNERNVQVKNAITALLEDNGWGITYTNILKVTLQVMFEDDYDEGYGYPNYENIHVIDDGDYQGMLLFIVPEYGYQPSVYWKFTVFYGSCSYCDTLQSILEDNDDKDQQIMDLMTLALHMIQSGKVI